MWLFKEFCSTASSWRWKQICVPVGTLSWALFWCFDSRTDVSGLIHSRSYEYSGLPVLLLWSHPRNSKHTWPSAKFNFQHSECTKKKEKKRDGGAGRWGAALIDVSLDSSRKESKDWWKKEKWMNAGQREKRKDEWVKTAESLGFCLKNQILLFMWSRLLPLPQALRKSWMTKERQWRANELLWGCVAALRGNQCGRLCTWFGTSLWHLLGLFFHSGVDDENMFVIFFPNESSHNRRVTERQTFEQLVALCAVQRNLLHLVGVSYPQRFRAVAVDLFV